MSFLSIIGGVLGKKLGGSVLGKVLGGSAVTGALGSAAGQAITDRNARHRAGRLQANYFVDLANNARRGGFHPLEALRAGGGQGYAGVTQRMPIGTSAAMQNQYDKITEILSGDKAKADAREATQDEYNRIQLDRLKRTPLGGFSAGLGSITSPGIPHGSTGTGDNAVDLVDMPEGATMIQGEGLERDPRTLQDADNFEAAYGELGGFIGGVRNLGMDANFRALITSNVADGTFPTRKAATEYYYANPDAIDPAKDKVRLRRQRLISENADRRIHERRFVRNSRNEVTTETLPPYEPTKPLFAPRFKDGKRIN